MEKKRILIADDEKAVRYLLAEALNHGNEYEIDVAKNGIEAIGKIDGKSYDLIISDYMMPGMDGLELTRRIRAKYPCTPILILTAHGPVYELLKSGATECMLKPFNLLEVQNMVKIILRQDGGRP